MSTSQEVDRGRAGGGGGAGGLGGRATRARYDPFDDDEISPLAGGVTPTYDRPGEAASTSHEPPPGLGRAATGAAALLPYAPSVLYRIPRPMNIDARISETWQKQGYPHETPDWSIFRTSEYIRRFESDVLNDFAQAHLAPKTSRSVKREHSNGDGHGDGDAAAAADRPVKKAKGRDDFILKGTEATVAEHYNLRPEVGKFRRNDSTIIHLKLFNNWIKSVLIQNFIRRAPHAPALTFDRQGRAHGPRSGRVLDLGCGKGGDLQKYLRAMLDEIVGIDIAEVTIRHAQARYDELHPPKPQGSFYALDCYSEDLDTVLPARYQLEVFDMVSLQFCMHYAFESEKKVRQMLHNVTSHLRPGGVFIGTIPDSDQILEKYQELEEGQTVLGNAIFSIRFQDRASDDPLYGHQYSFFLEDAVEDVPEYMVYWEPFVDLARSYGLDLIYRENFHTIYERHKDDGQFAHLLAKMGVMRTRDGRSMSKDEWDCAGLYAAFAFEKRTDGQGADMGVTTPLSSHAAADDLRRATESTVETTSLPLVPRDLSERIGHHREEANGEAQADATAHDSATSPAHNVASGDGNSRFRGSPREEEAGE